MCQPASVSALTSPSVYASPNVTRERGRHSNAHPSSYAARSCRYCSRQTIPMRLFFRSVPDACFSTNVSASICRSPTTLASGVHATNAGSIGTTLVSIAGTLSSVRDVAVGCPSARHQWLLVRARERSVCATEAAVVYDELDRSDHRHRDRSHRDDRRRLL